MSVLQARIERSVHAARPELRPHHGGELLAVAMARVAHDASQTLEAKPFDYGPACGGAVPDDGSVRTQRWLLRLLYPERTR